MKHIFDQLGVQVFPYVVTALGAVLCALLGMLATYIKSKTKNSKIQGAMDRLDQVMEDAVKSTQQSVIAAAKSDDNMADVLIDAKKTAIDSVKSHYGPKGIEELKKVLGWDDGLLNKNIDTKLEAKVHDLKALSNTVKAS